MGRHTRNIWFTFLLWVGLLHGQPGLPPVTIELPPVPPYPKDGTIPVTLKDRFVFLDEDTRELVVSFPSEMSTSAEDRKKGGRIVGRLPLQIGVLPWAEVTMQIDVRSVIQYVYLIGNRAQAKQRISIMRLPLFCKDAVTSTVAPDGWNSNVHAEAKDFGASSEEIMQLTWGEKQRERVSKLFSFRYASWWNTYGPEPEIRPGQKGGPFSLRTIARPGIVRLLFQGEPGISQRAKDGRRK